MMALVSLLVSVLDTTSAAASGSNPTAVAAVVCCDRSELKLSPAAVTSALSL